MSFIIYILNIQLKRDVRAAYITNLIHFQFIGIISFIQRE